MLDQLRIGTENSKLNDGISLEDVNDILEKEMGNGYQSEETLLSELQYLKALLAIPPVR